MNRFQLFSPVFAFVRMLRPLLGATMCATLVLSVASLIGCNQDDYHTMTRSAAGISDGLSQLQQTNEGAFRAGLITPSETIALANGVAEAVHANDVFTAALKNAKSVSAANKNSLMLDFGVVVATVQALDPLVLGIKNPDARAKFTAALQLVVLASNTIAAILQQQQSPAHAVPANQWRTHESGTDYFSDHDRRAAYSRGAADEARGELGRRAVAAARFGH